MNLQKDFNNCKNTTYPLQKDKIIKLRNYNFKT